MSEPTNLLDLTFHTDSKDLAQQLESIPNLQKINHLILKAGDAANLSDFWSLFKNFNEKLDELKVLELNVYVTASRTNGQECANQLLQGYTNILLFNDKVKKEGREVIFHSTAYNYNLDTLDDLNVCLDALKQDKRFDGMQIEIDDSLLQKITHVLMQKDLLIEFDVELRQAMDD